MGQRSHLFAWRLQPAPRKPSGFPQKQNDDAITMTSKWFPEDFDMVHKVRMSAKRRKCRSLREGWVGQER